MTDFTKILDIIDSYLPKDQSGNLIAEKEKSDVVHDVSTFLGNLKRLNND